MNEEPGGGFARWLRAWKAQGQANDQGRGASGRDGTNTTLAQATLTAQGDPPNPWRPDLVTTITVYYARW